jgi:hypothetical protein
MEAGGVCRPTTELFAMATPTETHTEPVNTETPSQGIFMGYLALGLLVFALAVALFAIYAGSTQGFQ